MSAYQFTNPAPILFTLSGVLPAVGGTLNFYDEGTTNLRNTWSDPALTTLNSNPVVLDASGRASTGIWLNGNYTVSLKDSLGNQVWSRVVRSDVSTGLSIPTLAAGYLTNDLTNLIWSDIAVIPSQTGKDNNVLSTAGGSLIWVSPSSAAGDKKQSVAATATTTINYSLGATIALSQDINTTIAFSNLPASGSPAYIIIVRTKDATATARTITWPAGIKWQGGVPAPTQTTGGVDVFGLLTYDGGTTFYGTAKTNLT